MVAYVQVDEIIAGLHQYLAAIVEQCRELHAAVQELYIEYPIEGVFQKLMLYAIRDFTCYRYSQVVWQSMMEVRMHPRSRR